MLIRLLVWKVALRILNLWVSHPVSALCAVLAPGCVVHCLLHDLNTAPADWNLSALSY